MAHELAPIRVSPDTDLSSVLAAAKNAPVRLEKDGVIYRVAREVEDVWDTYDAEAVRAGMRAAAGHLTPDEAEELKNYIYRAREEGTRPPKRL